MSVGNYGAVRNALEQMIAASFPATASRGNQGIALTPFLLDRVLTRPDFVNTLNGKIYFPTFNGAATNTIASTAVNPVAVLYDNSQAATDAYIVLFGVVAGSVTLGTTNPSLVIFALRGTSGVVVLPSVTPPLTNTGWSWDSTTNIYAGATRSTTTTVQVAAIYTA